MRQYLLIGGLLTTGVVLGALATSANRPAAPEAPPGAARAAHPAAQSGETFDPLYYAQIVDSLSSLVNLEVAERRRLEVEVEALISQVQSLEAQIASRDGGNRSARESQVRKETMRQAEQDDERRIAAFVDAGFALEKAEYLKAKQDEIALERLFLRDQARREGWVGSSRYSEALRELNERHSSLREELGEQDYDRYLYATGRPNRVMVRSVLEGSPAQRAGLQPGDSILSYDGTRLFDSRALVSATGAGTFGASTPVEIERDGQRMLLYIPRGPLGVNLRVARVDPNS